MEGVPKMPSPMQKVLRDRGERNFAFSVSKDAPEPHQVVENNNNNNS